MKKCSSCAEEILDAARVCPHCKAEQYKKCPSCAEEILADAKKCKFCGQVFGAIPKRSSSERKCPFCEHEGVPYTKTTISTTGWIVFALLLVFCTILCWIPLVSNSFKESHLYCGRCGRRIA